MRAYSYNNIATPTRHSYVSYTRNVLYSAIQATVVSRILGLNLLFMHQITPLLAPTQRTLHHLCSGTLTGETYTFNHQSGEMHPITLTLPLLVGKRVLKYSVSAFEVATSACATVVVTSLISKLKHQMTCVCNMRSGVHIPRQCRSYQNRDLGMHTIMQNHVASLLGGQHFLQVISLFPVK